MRIAIRGGHLIDPANGIDAPQDLFIVDQHVVGIGVPPVGFRADQEIYAGNKVVCPGLIDLCARLREPGQEHKADIASETRAAASAGITTLVCPPDTDPVIDEAAVVELIRRRSEAAGYARVLPLGALTRGLRGEQLSEMASLKEAGCIGISNASTAIADTLVMRRSLEYAATYDLTVFLTPADPWLSAYGCAHAGQVATYLGLPAVPEAAETTMVARDLVLNEDIGVRLHFFHLSSARSLEMIIAAQARGMPVTADVSIHHLHLTETDLGRFNSYCHVMPPLRSASDRTGLREGVVSGKITAICSDHQPHDHDAKKAPFFDTEPGISGLETLLSLGLCLTEGERRILSRSTLIERFTVGPARVLRLNLGTLGVGAIADVCIFDPECRRVLASDDMLSMGRNSPFLGWSLPGRVTHTLLAGRLVYQNP